MNRSETNTLNTKNIDGTQRAYNSVSSKWTSVSHFKLL